MNDRAVGQKEAERIILDHFLESYEHVVGFRLCEYDARETPDFLVISATEEKFGVELTCVMRSPDQRFRDALLIGPGGFDPQDALDEIYRLVEKKVAAQTRAEDFPLNRTIVVLALMECPLDDLRSCLDKSLVPDFESFGLFEVWLADMTTLDPWGSADLFGVWPKRWWGYHQGPRHSSKPYG